MEEASDLLLDVTNDRCIRAALPLLELDRSKPVQDGVRVKPPTGVTWSQLSSMRAQQIHDKAFLLQGFLPLPRANHPELYAVKAAVLQPTRLRGHPTVQRVPVHPAK